MAILATVVMNKQGRTITKTKTKCTRITDDVTTNTGTMIHATRQSENEPRRLLEGRCEELWGLSPQQNNCGRF